MNGWAGKVALVTGASSGIGAFICRELLTKHNMVVIGCARSEKRLQRLQKQLVKRENYPGEFIPYVCDMSKEDDIMAMHRSISSTQDSLHLCINNALADIESKLLGGDTSNWRDMLEVAVLGQCINIREATSYMHDQIYPNHRHIIHIGSTYGTFPRVRGYRGGYAFYMYEGLQEMSRALADGLRRELDADNDGIKVTSIHAGPVKTSLLAKSTTQGYATHFFNNYQCIRPRDIAATVSYILNSPQHVEVQDIVMKPIPMKYREKLL